MSEKYVVVKCGETMCRFYNAEPNSRTMCRCTHPAMPHQVKANPCPLYIVDLKKLAVKPKQGS